MRILFILVFIFGGLDLAYATVTGNYTPHAKLGQSTTTLENASIIDTGSASGFGNVGIGSITPGQVLDVQGTIRGTGFINSSGTTGAMICLTAAHQLGHCTGSASCSSTCTCTCAVN